MVNSARVGRSRAAHFITKIRICQQAKQTKKTTQNWVVFYLIQQVNLAGNFERISVQRGIIVLGKKFNHSTFHDVILNRPPNIVPKVSLSAFRSGFLSFLYLSDEFVQLLVSHVIKIQIHFQHLFQNSLLSSFFHASQPDFPSLSSFLPIVFAVNRSSSSAISFSKFTQKSQV